MSCAAYALRADLCVSHKEDQCGEEHSEALLKKGCDGGDGTSCGMLAARHFDDTERFVALSKRACNLGQAFGCIQWSSWLLKGTHGQAKNVTEGLRVLERACNAGSLTSCAMLSSIYEEGRDGAPKDLAKVAEIDARICPRGMIGSCKRAADAFRKAPPGVSRDLERSVKLYRQACHMRDIDNLAGESCLELSRLLRHWGSYSGQPTTKAHVDESMAAAADACHKAGLDCHIAAYRARERAFAEDRRRCAAREADACVRLEVHLYESGCERKDDADSCAALEARDPARLKAVRFRQCTKSRKADSAGCRSFERLGGKIPEFASAATPAAE
jgi:TPR repeat protein